jgi:hypothetical protein
MPTQGHADVTRHAVGKLNDLYLQLVAARPKVLLPQLIDFLRRAGKCFFPAGLLLIDGAALFRAQLVGKAKDLDLNCSIFMARSMIAIPRRIASSSEMPDGLLSSSMSAFFSACAAASIRACFSASSASCIFASPP